MLTARATISNKVNIEIRLCIDINDFAIRERGNTSVGLNALELVKDK